METIARRYFESEKVVGHYFREGQRVGLWKSEEILLGSVFSKTDRILDLGCGTGRIAFGLEKLGFTSVTGADFSGSMVAAAQEIALGMGSSVAFHQADARELPWQEKSFDGIVFGFNGYFMIPGAAERIKALREIYRVLKPGGRFVFTGHDRTFINQKSYWQGQSKAWSKSEAKNEAADFGDVVSQTELGEMFIHSTSVEEVELLLTSHNFQKVETWLRSELANEGALVRSFSDECRFWKAVKPVS